MPKGYGYKATNAVKTKKPKSQKAKPKPRKSK